MKEGDIIDSFGSGTLSVEYIQNGIAYCYSQYNEQELAFVINELFSAGNGFWYTRSAKKFYNL